jgi:hypothetical protein
VEIVLDFEDERECAYGGHESNNLGGPNTDSLEEPKRFTSGAISIDQAGCDAGEKQNCCAGTRGRARISLRCGHKCGNPALHSRAAEPEERESNRERCEAESDASPRWETEKGIRWMDVGTPGKIGATP